MSKASIKHIELELERISYVASAEVIEGKEGAMSIKVMLNEELTTNKWRAIHQVVNHNVPVGTEMKLEIKVSTIAKLKSMLGRVFKK